MDRPEFAKDSSCRLCCPRATRCGARRALPGLIGPPLARRWSAIRTSRSLSGAKAAG